MKRVGAAVSLSPRICPPNLIDHGAEGGLVGRCIGSRKRDEMPQSSALLYHGGISPDTVDSTSDYHSFVSFDQLLPSYEEIDAIPLFINLF